MQMLKAAAWHRATLRAPEYPGTYLPERSIASDRNVVHNQSVRVDSVELMNAK